MLPCWQSHERFSFRHTYVRETMFCHAEKTWKAPLFLAAQCTLVMRGTNNLRKKNGKLYKSNLWIKISERIQFHCNKCGKQNAAIILVGDQITSSRFKLLKTIRTFLLSMSCFEGRLVFKHNQNLIF